MLSKLYLLFAVGRWFYDPVFSTLAGGINAVRAVGRQGGVTVEDSLTWTYAPPVVPEHAVRDAFKND